MAWPLRRYFRLLWWTLCLLTFLALPLTIWEFQKQHYDVHYQAWFIGGIFVILSMPISIYEIAMHTEYYTQPRLQKHVIRILLMVPIYAVDAWFALRFQKAREYLDPIRECYEAFVIYSFFAYLMAFLQDTYGDLDEHMSKKPQMQHMWGLSLLLRPWDMGTRFLWECKKGVLNYVILRPVCTGLAFITDIFNKYGEGQINFSKSYVYLAAITNFSQLWALYCLIMLYTAMHDELAPIRPLSKFICIKAVVFVTFWQGIAIAILVYFGVIKASESWYARQDVASGIQDFLICIEMFLAALAHAYAFPPRDYMAGHSKGFFTNVRYIFDLRDVVDDVGLVVEEHVSTATTAVVKVPQRAVKKAAQGLAKNTKKLFAAAGKGSSGRLVDEEEEAASKCALLGPASPPEKGGVGGRSSNGGGGGAGAKDISSGGGAGPSSTSPSLGAWRGAGGIGIGMGERRTSSGGSGGGGGTEALLGSYDSRDGRLGPLAAPHQHLMLHQMEPSGPASPALTATVTAAASAAAAAAAAAGTSGPSHHHLPPLPPSSAALTHGGGAGGIGGGGSAFNALVTSALYNTRGGYDGGGGGAAAGATRASAANRRTSGDYGGGESASYGEYSDFASMDAIGTTGTAVYGGGAGGEVPLVAVGHSGRQGQRAAAAAAGSLAEGAAGAAGGSGGRVRTTKKTNEVSVRAGRAGSGGVSGAATGLLSGGASSGDDSPYERFGGSGGPFRRAHDE